MLLRWTACTLLITLGCHLVNVDPTYKRFNSRGLDSTVLDGHCRNFLQTVLTWLYRNCPNVESTLQDAVFFLILKPWSQPCKWYFPDAWVQRCLHVSRIHFIPPVILYLWSSMGDWTDMTDGLPSDPHLLCAWIPCRSRNKMKDNVSLMKWDKIYA